MQTSPHSVLRDVDDRRNLPITQPSNWPSTFPARWSEGRAAILRADHRLCAAITERTGIPATSSVLALEEVLRETVKG